MLQLRELNRQALQTPTMQELLSPQQKMGDELEDYGNRVINLLRQERVRIGGHATSWCGLSARLDRAVRCDSLELLDNPTYPDSKKMRIVHGLHLFKLATGTYREFFNLLMPMLQEITNKHHRPARLLELACGTGGFSLAMAAHAAKKNISVEVTGSDIVPLYLERAQAQAHKSKNAANFKILDALNMHDVSPGSFDIVFMAQSAHHFSPGQLTRMMSETSRVATTAFISVDGYRSLTMLGVVTGSAMMTLMPPLIHDALISARKFYSDSELELMAHLACPQANISSSRMKPLNSYVMMRFDG